MNIEKKVSQSGHQYLCLNGNQLCSKYNPEKEAQQWVEKVGSRANEAPTLIVLGLGSGYHVAALNKKYPQKKILVVEPCEEIVSANFEIHPFELEKVSLIQEKTMTEILVNSDFRKGIQDLYIVINYVGASKIHQELFGELQKVLIGRGETEFQKILDFRPRLKNIFTSNQGLRNVSPNLLSIKTLNEWVKAPVKGYEKEFMMIRALKELVN